MVCHTHGEENMARSFNMARRQVDQQPQALLMRHGLEMIHKAFDVSRYSQRTGLRPGSRLALVNLKQAVLSRRAADDGRA